MHIPLQVVEWTPQNELLGDGRVKAFVTHGGLNSIYEASSTLDRTASAMRREHRMQGLTGMMHAGFCGYTKLC